MLTRIQEIQLRNQVQRVLHVPGNYNGGPLEMAVVFDTSLEKEDAVATGKLIAAAEVADAVVVRVVPLL